MMDRHYVEGEAYRLFFLYESETADRHFLRHDVRMGSYPSLEKDHGFVVVGFPLSDQVTAAETRNTFWYNYV